MPSTVAKQFADTFAAAGVILIDVRRHWYGATVEDGGRWVPVGEPHLRDGTSARDWAAIRVFRLPARGIEPFPSGLVGA